MLDISTLDFETTVVITNILQRVKLNTTTQNLTFHADVDNKFQEKKNMKEFHKQ